MATVALKNITKVFPGNVTAVRDFTLSIENEEFVVLVGPSGCGKSTVLRMIAGLEDITGGDLEIDGVRVNDLPPKDRDIAMVFQNYALYPHMTVYDNMAFGLKLRRFSGVEIDGRVREAAEILGLSEYLHRRPKALSGGQRQRVAVGRAIVRKPKVFLFDEPLSNLDAKMRVQMRTELSQLHARLKSTIVYVTHDQVEAMTMGSRIVVMKDGVIQQVGEPLEIYRTPANQFVAGFIGTPPMNLFRGTVHAGGVALGGRELPLEDTQRDKVRSSGLTEAVVGIRPEHLVLTQDPRAALFEAVVDIVEPLGAESLLHARLGDSRFVASIDPSERLRTGDHVRFSVRPGHVMVFDPATERAVA